MENTEDKEPIVEAVSVNDAATDTSGATDTPESDTDTNPEIEKLMNEIRELNDKYLRVAAELENTRRRAAVDADAAARRRAMSIASYFLPVMDAADAALAHTPDDAGIQSMARAIQAAFAQIGIVRIESIGQILNPKFHNAIQVIDAPADAEPRPAPNTVLDEMQAGYMFGDTVLRTAMVVVSK